MTQYQFPFPLDTITTDFGAVDSLHPNPHRGTDFAPGGLDILAVSDGVVVRSERQFGLGWVVTVQAPDGVFWSCCHMVGQSPVSVGDSVVRGRTVVGTVGNTGSLTSGRHLHFTMSTSSDDPASGSTFDCVPYISARLSSTAGGGTIPFPNEQEEEDDMSYKVIEQAAPDGGGLEWMLVAPWFADVKDPKQRGYLVTTDKDWGANWKRAHGAGDGKPHARVDRSDYLIIQESARGLHAQWVAANPPASVGAGSAPTAEQNAAAVKKALAPDFTGIAPAVIVEQKKPGN